MSPKNKVVAKAFIRHNQKFLILKRSETDTKLPLKWDLAGGKIDEGESIDEGFLREVKEESGLELSRYKLLYSVTSAKDVLDTQAKNFVFLIFFAESTSDEVMLSFEHSEYRWVDKEELFEPMRDHPVHEAAFKHIFDNNLDTI